MKLELDISTKKCSDNPGLFQNLWGLPSLSYLECRFTDTDQQKECCVMSPVFPARRGPGLRDRQEFMQTVTEVLASRMRDREVFPAHTEFTPQHDFEPKEPRFFISQPGTLIPAHHSQTWSEWEVVDRSNQDRVCLTSCESKAASIRDALEKFHSTDTPTP